MPQRRGRKIKKDNAHYFWSEWMLLAILRSCPCPGTLHLPILTKPHSMAITDFPLRSSGEGERLILHLSNQVDLSKESHHVRAGRGFRDHMSQPGGTGKTRRLRRGQGIHSVTGRVQNGNPGVLMIRLEALAII